MRTLQEEMERRLGEIEEKAKSMGSEMSWVQTFSKLLRIKADQNLKQMSNYKFDLESYGERDVQKGWERLRDIVFEKAGSVVNFRDPNHVVGIRVEGDGDGKYPDGFDLPYIMNGIDALQIATGIKEGKLGVVHREAFAHFNIKDGNDFKKLNVDEKTVIAILTATEEKKEELKAVQPPQQPQAPQPSPQQENTQGRVGKKTLLETPQKPSKNAPSLQEQQRQQALQQRLQEQEQQQLQEQQEQLRRMLPGWYQGTKPIPIRKQSKEEQKKKEEYYREQELKRSQSQKLDSKKTRKGTMQKKGSNSLPTL